MVIVRSLKPIKLLLKWTSVLNYYIRSNKTATVGGTITIKNFSHGKIYYYLVPRHLSLCRGSEGVDMTTFITERYQQLLYFILLHGYRIGSLLGGIVFTLKHQTKKIATK